MPCSDIFLTNWVIRGLEYGGLSQILPDHCFVNPSSFRLYMVFAVGHNGFSGAQGSKSKGPNDCMMSIGVYHSSDGFVGCSWFGLICFFFSAPRRRCLNKNFFGGIILGSGGRGGGGTGGRGGSGRRGEGRCWRGWARGAGGSGRNGGSSGRRRRVGGSGGRRRGGPGRGGGEARSWLGDEHEEAGAGVDVVFGVDVAGLAPLAVALHEADGLFDGDVDAAQVGLCEGKEGMV